MPVASSVVADRPQLRGHLRWRDGVVAVHTPGETMVLTDLSRGQYYTLNAVAARIWELLGPGATMSDIVGQLAAEYDVAVTQLEKDVAVAIEQLAQAALIVGS